MRSIDRVSHKEVNGRYVMLVLSRKAKETIVFPELGISLKVVRVKGNVVQLGIEAPDSVRILRGELEAIVNEFQGPASKTDLDPAEMQMQVA